MITISWIQTFLIWIGEWTVLEIMKFSPLLFLQQPISLLKRIREIDFQGKLFFTQTNTVWLLRSVPTTRLHWHNSRLDINKDRDYMYRCWCSWSFCYLVYLWVSNFTINWYIVFAWTVAGAKSNWDTVCFFHLDSVRYDTIKSSLYFQ